ncbi:MAG: FMN-binding protein [Herbinix sp.]|jgi:uncharacterized protein with FMN-binding domain|nr:FMN-binding protein [Herbinix sp.]
MKRKVKMILIILSVIVILALVIFLWYLNSVQNYKNKVAAISIEDIDISSIPDGSYFGEYDVDFIYAKVEVLIQDGTITNINLIKHKNGEGKPAEQIIDTILQKQSLQVDAISGATNSSQVIKKAIENALTLN